MTETENAFPEQSELNRFYDTVLQSTGYPPQIAIFDPQLARALGRDWLTERAQIEEGVERPELETMLAEGLIQTWKDAAGQQGFIIYSPHQAGVFKKLKEVGRYELEELQHIAECWGDYLGTVIIDEPPYDSHDVSDFEHFRRRATEIISSLEEDVARGPSRSYLDADHALQQFELIKQRLSEWRHTATILAGKTEETLSDRLRSAIQRQLWHLRWVEEFVRISMAQQFEAQILEGYSVEVTFNATSWHDGETALSDISWSSTFRRVKEMRREGHRLPLRMPDFNVTEKGIELLRPLTPEQYSAMYSRHNMQEMVHVLNEMGSEIWSPAPLPIGDSTCAECAATFYRGRPTQIYCSERCRRRAKNRRWRERDPERARQCQARYWKSYCDIN